MSDVWSDTNICYEVQDNPGNCILAPVKLLPSVIFPLNRALIYAQTARWTVTELHVSKSPGSNSLGGCCCHKFLELGLGRGDQMMLSHKLSKTRPLTQTSWVQSFTFTISTCPSSVQQLSKVIGVCSYFCDISVCWGLMMRFRFRA